MESTPPTPLTTTTTLTLTTPMNQELQKKMDKHFDQLDATFVRLDAQLEKLHQSTMAHFDRIDASLDRIENNVDRITGRLDDCISDLRFVVLEKKRYAMTTYPAPPLLEDEEGEQADEKE